MNWEYLTGFFDGEGWVGLPSQPNTLQFSPRVTLIQAKERGRVLLTEIQEFLAKEGITSTVTARQHDIFALDICGRNNTIPFIEKILPYSRIKKLEAQDVWRFLKMYPSRNKREYRVFKHASSI